MRRGCACSGRRGGGVAGHAGGGGGAGQQATGPAGGEEVTICWGGGRGTAACRLLCDPSVGRCRSQRRFRKRGGTRRARCRRARRLARSAAAPGARSARRQNDQFARPTSVQRECAAQRPRRHARLRLTRGRESPEVGVVACHADERKNTVHNKRQSTDASRRAILLCRLPAPSGRREQGAATTKALLVTCPPLLKCPSYPSLTSFSTSFGTHRRCASRHTTRPAFQRHIIEALYNE